MRVLSVIRPIFFLGRAVNNGTSSFDNNTETINAAAEAKKTVLEDEIQSLHRLLGIKEVIKLPTHVLSVVSYRNEAGKEMLVLNGGESSGIKVGDIAVDENKFVVGTIREVGQDFSKVSVASNEGEVYEVEFVPLHAKALARGVGGGAFTIELIPADFTLRKGDFLTLFGTERDMFFLSEITGEDSNGGAALKVARAVRMSEPEHLHEVLVLSLGASK